MRKIFAINPDDGEFKGSLCDFCNYAEKRKSIDGDVLFIALISDTNVEMITSSVKTQCPGMKLVILKPVTIEGIMKKTGIYPLYEVEYPDIYHEKSLMKLDFLTSYLRHLSSDERIIYVLGTFDEVLEIKNYLKVCEDIDCKIIRLEYR